VIADILDEGEYLRVIVEMPGVDELDLSYKSGVLQISLEKERK
jgi:HSP20 family molecular chaperone IbpA